MRLSPDELGWRKSILVGPWTLTKLDREHGDVFESHALAVFDWMRSRILAAETV